MIKVIIVDDEISAIKGLEYELSNFSEDVEIIKMFTNSLEALSAINNLKPDCVFLDIEMPYIDGFQLLSKLTYRDFDLIITTAFDNYAIRAFKENAMDYLLKPIDTDDLARAISKIKNNKKKNNLGDDLKKTLETLIPKVNKTKISLPLSGKTIFVNTNDIVYCKSDGNYTEIHFKNKKVEVVSKKLKIIEEVIENELFFRVHNSYLVNIDCIAELVRKDGQYLVLENGVTIPVSRNKKEALLDLLNY
jgi:two-component system LytT family response regulator